MSDRSRHLRRQFASASVAFMMLALAGCGSNADSDVGHLEGTVATKGGPSGAIHRVEATVVATPLDGDGDPYSVQTDGNASFSLELPAGEYTLSGTLTTLNPGDQLTPQDVTVTSGDTTTVELFALYP